MCICLYVSIYICRGYKYQRFSMPKEQLPLPPDLTRPADFMNDYLRTLRLTNKESENKLLRYKRSRATRRYNEVTKAKGKILTLLFISIGSSMTKIMNLQSKFMERFQLTLQMIEYRRVLTL